MRTLNLLLCLLSFCFYNVYHLYSEEIPFFESDGWNRIYLATFPRSGNHWMRYLFEESTHIATSAVYQATEGDHLEEVLPWGAYSTKEGYFGNCKQPTKNDPVLIKTHFPQMLSQPGDTYYSFINIRIIRNPVDTCWSFFVHHFPNHDYPDKVPHEFVVIFIESWKKFQEYWNHDIDCVSFRYEDISDHPKEVLTEFMGVIGYRVSEEDIERAIEKYPPKNKELQHIEHFEKEDLELMKVELKDYLDDFHYQIP